MLHPRILQLDETGTPNSWCDWQDAVTYQAKEMIVWSLGEATFTFTGGKSRMTGEISTITVPSIIAVRNKTKVKHRPPVLTNCNLFRRDLQTCAYCGTVHANDEKLTRDHIIPVSKGGPNTWMNTITACKGCNNYKGSHLLETIDMKLLFIPYVPTKAENMILANRKILGDQMEFLKSYLPEHSRVHKMLLNKG
jgi:5-methylcytosine-specific restriction endonuclease McrA